MDYTLTLTQQEVQTILAALGEVPLKHSLNLFAKLQSNIAEQDKQNAVELVTE